MFVQVVRRFEFAFHFPDESSARPGFPCGPAGRGSWPGNNVRARIGAARQQLAARGDALDGEGGALGVVRGKIRQIKTCAGKLPRGREVIGVRLQLHLRTMKFRLGAGGKNRLVGGLARLSRWPGRKSKATRRTASRSRASSVFSTPLCGQLEVAIVSG